MDNYTTYYIMADNENATRAPESDLHDASTTTSSTTSSIFPGDTPAQEGPTMGEHCTTDRPLPTSSAKPAGEMSSLNNVPCYISKPSSYPHSPGKLLLLLTGGTGIHSVNNQLQADAFADRGFVVIMPDQFGGNAAPGTATTTTVEAASAPTFLERLKLGAVETAKSFIIDMWLAKHTPVTVLPILQKAIEGAHEEFADAVANGGGIYGAGYCFGAKYILLLCGEDASNVLSGHEAADVEKQGDAGKMPQLKVGAIAHGTLITKEDMAGIKMPVLMACVGNDQLFPDDVREQGRASLELNAIEHEIKVFEGVPHGFAVVGDYNDENIREKQSEAFEMMCGWLEAH